LTGFAGLVCATDGAALADAAVTGVVLAAAAGVVLAAAVAGVGVATVFAGVVEVATAGVVLGVAGVVLGDVFALVVAAFLSFRFSVDFSFLSAGVALAPGRSVEVFVSGPAFRVVERAFFSGLVVAAGDSVAVVSFTADSFTAGASVFGARVVFGFTSAGAFFSGACFLLGDCSGVGSWAITAPASASEQTISKLVIFFMVALFCRLTEAIYSTLGFSLPAMLPIATRAGLPAQSIDRLTVIIRACLPLRSCPATP
jgi:hypothetical protein